MVMWKADAIANMQKRRGGTVVFTGGGEDLAPLNGKRIVHLF